MTAVGSDMLVFQSTMAKHAKYQDSDTKASSLILWFKPFSCCDMSKCFPWTMVGLQFPAWHHYKSNKHLLTTRNSHNRCFKLRSIIKMLDHGNLHIIYFTEFNLNIFLFEIITMKYQVMMLTIFHNISFTLQPKVSFEINVNIIYNTGFLTYSSTTGRVARGHCSRSFGGKLITMYCTNQLYWKKNRKAFLLDNHFYFIWGFFPTTLSFYRMSSECDQWVPALKVQ